MSALCCTDALDIRRKLRDDYAYYASKALKIRTKSGAIEPLVFNTAQQYIHTKLEEQKTATGKVRAILLKGRQQGCSTYVEGRFYHRTTNALGIRTFILTHENDATANLFDMVERYHENVPDALRPYAGTSNRKELTFDKLNGGYRVGTAGSKGAGRSSTIQLFHGSEVAFWPHAADHAAGALQAVPNAPGTEIILESTANGMGNYYHQQWLKAVAGRSEFIAVFVPWYWQTEYAEDVDGDLALSEEEHQYAELYGLTARQMLWRRNKIESLGDPLLFKQEYPATADEAFQTTGIESFIPPVHVMEARKRPEGRSYGAVIAGFDPAQSGDDRDSFIYRQGPNAFDLQYMQLDFPSKIAFCVRVLESMSPRVDMMFIDYGGGGWELGSMLKERGYGARVKVINFGAKAVDGPAYLNRRAEMWGKMKDWLTDPNVPVSLPDDDALHADIVAPTFKYDSMQRIVLEAKEQIKSRGLPSPDGGDALALTFAEPIVREHVMGTMASNIGVAQTKYDLFKRRA